MQITIPKVLKRLSLSAYAAELDTCFIVWVNIPAAMRSSFEDRRRDSVAAVGERIQLQRKLEACKPADKKKAELQQQLDANDKKLQALESAFHAFFAEVWSQGADEASHVSVSDIHKLIEDARDTDPSFYFWLTGETVSMIDEHRQAKKKKFS
jgi:hypothetical protein